MVQDLYYLTFFLQNKIYLFLLQYDYNLINLINILF